MLLGHLVSGRQLPTPTKDAGLPISAAASIIAMFRIGGTVNRPSAACCCRRAGDFTPIVALLAVPAIMAGLAVLQARRADETAAVPTGSTLAHS